MRLSHVLFSSFIVLFLVSCSYKPSSHYVREEIKGNIFVSQVISLSDPRNAVIIKDAMNELIVHRLDSKIVYDRELADTIINLELDSVKMYELQYDEQGYNKLYKAVVKISVDYMKKGSSEKKSFSVTGDYDFSIDDGTTITDTKRFEAIKNAASKALEELISKMAVSTFEKEEN